MPTDVFSAHDQDWASFELSRGARAALQRWQAADPLLAPFSRMVDLRAQIGDRSDLDRQDTLLLAVLGQAREDGAARRLVLRTITPGLVRVTRAYEPRWGRDETAGMVMVAAIEKIAGYPIRRRTAVAANLVRDVRHTLYLTRLRELTRTGGLPAPLPLDDLDGLARDGRQTASEEVLELVDRAVAAGRISERAGRLIVLHRVFDVSGPTLAACEGASYEAVKKYRLRAEAALAEAIPAVA